MPQKELNLRNISKALQTRYSYILMGRQMGIIIGDNYIKGMNFGPSDKRYNSAVYLSDSMILKQDDNLYIFNTRVSGLDTLRGNWNAYILSSVGRGFLKATFFGMGDTLS